MNNNPEPENLENEEE